MLEGLSDKEAVHLVHHPATIYIYTEQNVYVTAQFVNLLSQTIMKYQNKLPKK